MRSDINTSDADVNDTNNERLRALETFVSALKAEKEADRRRSANFRRIAAGTAAAAAYVGGLALAAHAAEKAGRPKTVRGRLVRAIAAWATR